MIRIFFFALLAGSFVCSAQINRHDDLELFRSFGTEFLWGTSCSAYQIEGAWNIDGRSPSVWDEFAQKKGNTHNNDNGNEAVDFYHRYKEDIRIHKELNFKVFKFLVFNCLKLHYGKSTTFMSR